MTLHYDGKSWTRTQLDLKSGEEARYFTIEGLWGTADGGTKMAVGYQSYPYPITAILGHVWAWNKQRWERVAGGYFPVDSKLHGIWGSSATNVMVVGEYGRVHVGDGTSWKTLHTKDYCLHEYLDKGCQLRGVWGSSPTNVYVVGFKGTVLHYDGKTFRGSPTGVFGVLNSVWGAPGLGIFVAGQYHATSDNHYLQQSAIYHCAGK